MAPCLRRTKLQSVRRIARKKNQRCAKGSLLICKKLNNNFQFQISRLSLCSCFRNQISNSTKSSQTSSSTVRACTLTALNTPEKTRPSMKCRPSRRVKHSTWLRPQVNARCINCLYCHARTHSLKKTSALTCCSYCLHAPQHGQTQQDLPCWLQNRLLQL